MNPTMWPEVEKSNLKYVAEKMLLAAKTAPKGRGIDNLVLATIEGDDIKKLSDHMKSLANQHQIKSFERDAENILKAPVVVLLGTKVQSLGLKKCGFCGFEDCAEREATQPSAPCAFNTGDLGIAVGSAVSIAMDHRVDNRIMYSVGFAAIDLKLLHEDVGVAYGIPLSATGKNPFFDRS